MNQTDSTSRDSGKDSGRLEVPHQRDQIDAAVKAVLEALARHGYSDDGVRKILGGNLMRVFEAVWKD